MSGEVWPVIFQAGSLLGAGSAVTAAVKAVMDRRKVKVDNTEVLTRASAAMVQGMQSDLNEAKDQLRKFQQALWNHQRWDRMVIRKLNELNVTDVPDPPELFL